MSGKQKKTPIISFLLAGNSAVGKTSIVDQYQKQEINPNHITTLGVDCRLITKPFMVDGQQVTIKAKMWDSAGQQRFQNLVLSAIQNTQGVLLIYDITEPETFSDCEGWIGKISGVKDLSKFPIFFVGNKKDLEAKRKITKAQAEEFAKKHDFKYFEVSALTGEGIQQVIDEFIVEVYKKRTGKNGISLDDANKDNKSGCCLFSKEKKNK